MPNPNLATGSIKALDHVTTRTFAEHLGDVVNVRGMGATGDGVTDDTAAIQAAFDLAFGVDGAHGLNYGLNKPVYFPAGNYQVSPVATATISAMADNGGLIRLTVNSTAGFATGMIVNLYGIGGLTVYNKTAVGIIVDDATHMTLRGSDSTNVAAYTSGGNVVGPCLLLRNIQGAHIYGDSRLATGIQSTAAGSCPVSTNGFGYSVVERMAFQGPSSNGGTGFCYNWDNTGLSSQAVTFRDCAFGGDYGLDIGSGQYMCSETMIMNCHFGGTTAGLINRNYNALQQTVIGGNFQSCGIGIYVVSGSVPIIQGVGFQNFAGMDIEIQNSVGDGYVVSGCRSESDNFIMPQPTTPVTLIGCCQLNASDGYFVYAAGSRVTLVNCYSQNGKVHGGAQLNVVNTIFGRTDWNQWYGAIGAGLSVPYWSSKTANFPPVASMSGTIYDNTGASGEVIFTLPTSPDVARLPPGTWFGFYVAAAQSLKVKAGTGATVRVGPSVSATAGNAANATIGSYVEFVCLVDGGAAWAAKSVIGTWTVT